jgi:hypothetical protein
MQNAIESIPHQPAAGIEQMLRRIQSEFLEMPGLRLTLSQAQRLWNLDDTVCEPVLAALVDVHFLVRTADGSFIRSTDTVCRDAVSRASRRIA